MNLVGTLAKVAMGVMVSRGIGKMLGGGGGGGGGLGGLLGGALGGGGNQQQAQGGAGGLGGLGGLLGGLTGGAQSGSADQQSAGGLGGMLGSVLSGAGQSGGQAGGLGGLLGSLGGGQQQGAGGSGIGGIGEMLNQALSGQATPEPKPDENAQAEIMLRGMINAAKSDGQIDQAEQAKILEHLGDVSQDEANFVRTEMAKPLDLDGFVASVPNGLEQQVYLMSLLGIKLDSQAEAQYLDRLAKGMGITPDIANQIHAKVGVPSLYG